MEIKIRPLKIEDAYTSVEWRNDKEVFKFTGNTYSQEITLESELKWINRVINNQNEYRCAILAGNKYVGNIYLTDIQDKQAEYHIFIGDKRYWGKGIAKIASEQIIRYGFQSLGLSRIILSVNKKNLTAIKLYEKLGFKVINDLPGHLQMELLNPCKRIK